MSNEMLFAALAFRGWFPPWVALLLGLASVAVIVLLYRREVGRLFGSIS